MQPRHYFGIMSSHEYRFAILKIVRERDFARFSIFKSRVVDSRGSRKLHTHTHQASAVLTNVRIKPSACMTVCARIPRSYHFFVASNSQSFVGCSTLKRPDSLSLSFLRPEILLHILLFQRQRSRWIIFGKIGYVSRENPS